MKRAIALSGGGTKGSYELGVWKALRELGIDYQIVTGTSIGSINGALMTTGDYDKAYELWRTITMEDLMADGINLTTTIEGMYDQKDAIRPFLKKYVKNKGADISPFAEFIERLVDEDAIRASEIDFGLVTVLFPTLQPRELSVHDIPEGLLKDYLLASSAIFPLFPMHKIGDETYLDGCYHDNLPIDLALRMGATEVVAVDLHTTPAHAKYAGRPYVTYIIPSRSLGTMMNCDRNVLMNNMEMGYQDTMKTYGRLYGYQYTFYIEEFAQMETPIATYVQMIALIDRFLSEDVPMKKLAKKSDFNRVYEVILAHTDGRKLSGTECFIRGGEICGEIFGLDMTKTYHISEYIRLLTAHLGKREKYPEVELLCEREGIELAVVLKNLRQKKSQEEVTLIIYYAIQEEKFQEQLIRAILTLFPKELAAAILLCSL